MTGSLDDNNSDKSASLDDGPGRLRFQSIIAASENADIADDKDREQAQPTKNWAAEQAAFRREDWARAGERATYWSRFVAIFIFAVMAIGWPAGTAIGHYHATGSLGGLNLAEVFPSGAIMFATVVPVLCLLGGYLMSRQMTMMGAAESIATVAQQFMQPDDTAIYNVDAVGLAVRSQMAAINSGIDDALIRLASVEAMIRKHVEAIELAGHTIESQTSSAVTKVADERTRLISLTEALNTQADDFASAIAVKAQAGIEAINSGEDVSRQAETALSERLARLEQIASHALDSFESLKNALSDANDGISGQASRIENSAQDIEQATRVASNIADAAAESAARNAANIGAAAKRAAEASKSSADEAIACAQAETERAATSAIEFAAKEAERVADAAARALETVKDATSTAVSSAAEDALKATDAADQVSEAAQTAMRAAQEASDEVRKAGEAARSSAEEALKFTEATKGKNEAQQKQLTEARAALEQENERLETLIDEQRQRADRLADAIATQTERLSKLAEAQLQEQEASSQFVSPPREHVSHAQADAPKERAAAQPEPVPFTPKGNEKGEVNRLDEMAVSIARSRPKPRKEKGAGNQQRNRAAQKSDVSWSEILTAADDAAPLELGDAEQRKQPNGSGNPSMDEAMQIIHDLQTFTLSLETELYGDPPRALLERFDSGDRNIFANRLLRLNEADVKRRVRSEAGRNKKFDRSIHHFLHGFEKLLEDATTSETADEELEEYLSSPLGRVYLLIGATVGYFA